MSIDPSQRTNHLSITPTARWIITATVMLVTIIEILDMTIVNVALPPMMGELSANTDQITWVLTSYIVASAIVMPLTGFLVTRFGRRRLLLTNIIGFMIASMLCGLSTSLAQIVLFRVLQGVFGAALVPMSQYILSDIFSKEDQGKAMAIWGVGIMIAPILGPTLGGYITASMSWRWVFYINLPVCILAFFLTLQFIPETLTKKVKIDWFGLLLMTVGIGALQIFLDRGNTNDWFSSKLIDFLLITWIFALSLFFTRGVRIKNNIINLHLLKNRNLSAATLMLTIFGAAMFSVIAVIPLMLEQLMGYTAQLAGLFMAPRGIATAFGLILAARLMKRFDLRFIVAIGIIAAAFGSYLLCRFNLQSSFSVMLWPTFLIGFGSGLFFVPLSTAALTSLSEKDSAEGSGLFNFGRSLGGSIGISLVSTLITRETQINWNRLTASVQATHYNFQRWMHWQHLLVTSQKDMQLVMNEIARQSSMLAFNDAFFAVAISLIIMLPLILIMKGR